MRDGPRRRTTALAGWSTPCLLGDACSHSLPRRPFYLCADRTEVLNLSPSAIVADVKAAIECSRGVAAADQCVLFGGRQLDDEASLAECGVSDDSQLYVSLRLLGGGKKRKKKTYTTPKKQKHVHKKVQLRVLKLYKVSDDGKVQRLRKVCPSCGPGIFMATHFDRVYCGKCHCTYVYNEGS